MELHHIGVATDDAAATATGLTTALGVSECHSEVFDGMEIRYLAFERGYIELIEPLEGGTVARFLDNDGPGLHHIAMYTNTIEACLERAADAGITCIDKSPREGAWGLDVAFLHPADTGGILIEFVTES